MAEHDRPVRQHQSRTGDQNSCRTPGMAGKKALVTFRISLPHTMRPTPQKIQLFGSWTSYTTSIPMERDMRAGQGIWKSGGPKGGLEQGAVYGYYYVMDGRTIYYDPAAGRTVRDDRTGKVVNVIEVPMEMPSEEDQRIREKASIASILNPAEPGKAEGGGDNRGHHERGYEGEHQQQHQQHQQSHHSHHSYHHQQHASPRRKAESSAAAGRAPPPPPPHQSEYVHSPERRRNLNAEAVSPPTRLTEQPSLGSLRQYRSESSVSLASIPTDIPTKAQRRATEGPSSYPALASAPFRRKPVPTKDTTSSSLPHIAPRSDGGGIRKPYTFLGRKISIPSLPSTPDKTTPVPSHSSHFYSAYPPPPQASSSAFPVQSSPSPPIFPNDSASRGWDGAPVSKKESGSRGKRWSFLPQSQSRPPIPPSYAPEQPSSPPTAAINIPPPRRKIGRLFSMAKPYSTSAPRPDLNTRSTSLTVNNAYPSTTSIQTRGRTPSPLDIPAPPDFTLAQRHRTRTRGESMDLDQDQSEAQQMTAKKNSDSVNPGGETSVAEAQVEVRVEAEQMVRERLFLGAGRETPGLGLGAGPKASGAGENRVRGSFLPDRETRLGNIIRDEERGIRRLPRSVSMGGAKSSLNGIVGGDASSIRSGIHGGGFVMVGSDGATGEGASLYGGEDGDRGLRAEEVVSTPGTIIRLDPDEFRPRNDAVGNVNRLDIGNGNDTLPTSGDGYIKESLFTSMRPPSIDLQLDCGSFFIDTNLINSTPISIKLPSVVEGRQSSYHSSLNNSYSEPGSGNNTSNSTPSSSHSCSPRSTPSSSYSPKSSGVLDFLKRPASGRVKGGNRDIGPYAGDVILRNRIPTADDSAGGVLMTMGLEESSYGFFDGGMGSLEGAEGDGGVYHSPGGKVRYLKSLRCLKEEVAGELESRQEMWEELGWLGGAVL